MGISDKKTIEFCGEIRRETDKAFLVYDGSKEIWIPKSQIISLDYIKDTHCEIEIPEWLAIDKEIV